MTVKDQHFMRMKDIVLMVVACLGFYFAFIDRKIGEAKDAVTRADVSSMIVKESPYLLDKAALQVRLEAINDNLRDIKQQLIILNQIKADKK